MKYKVSDRVTLRYDIVEENKRQSFRVGFCMPMSKYIDRILIITEVMGNERYKLDDDEGYTYEERMFSNINNIDFLIEMLNEVKE